MNKSVMIQNRDKLGGYAKKILNNMIDIIMIKLAQKIKGGEKNQAINKYLKNKLSTKYKYVIINDSDNNNKQLLERLIITLIRFNLHLKNDVASDIENILIIKLGNILQNNINILNEILFKYDEIILYSLTKNYISIDELAKKPEINKYLASEEVINTLINNIETTEDEVAIYTKSDVSTIENKYIITVVPIKKNIYTTNKFIMNAIQEMIQKIVEQNKERINTQEGIDAIIDMINNEIEANELDIEIDITIKEIKDIDLNGENIYNVIDHINKASKLSK